ncbi:MAG: Flp family type IVb pilin [Acetobacter malorum]|uniref:Flp family type IVb pilin n=1 Tax=Acetobacter malorum TaxID=178901 RepID=UPI0039EA55D9
MSIEIENFSIQFVFCFLQPWRNAIGSRVKIFCVALPGRWTMEIMTTCLTRSFRLFAGDRKGVTALEYGLIAGCITLGIIGGVTMLGGKVGLLFSTLGDNFP